MAAQGLVGEFDEEEEEVSEIKADCDSLRTCLEEVEDQFVDMREEVPVTAETVA